FRQLIITSSWRANILITISVSLYSHINHLEPLSFPTRRSSDLRANVLRALRDSFHGRGFTEVETPMLQTLHGGASARPFTTHSNAFDMELYLRIAPELYLKRSEERRVGKECRSRGSSYQ